MKILLNIARIVLCVSFFSCEQTTVKNMYAAEVQDTLKKSFEVTEDEALKNRRDVEEQYRLDSIRLSSVLDNALIVAHQMFYTGKTVMEFDQTIDSVFDVTTIIVRGTLISPDFEHVIIKRDAPNNVLIDIYVMKNKKLISVLKHDQWALTYVADSLKDINGDGYKDYVLEWYGSNGCCLKAFSDVYLYQPKTGTFTEQFEFINPTFLPGEKIIRGVCYGHPGETEMYTYKWQGEAIDTIEYIAYERDKDDKKTGKFITYENELGAENSKKVKRLNTMPEEYKSIEGYDWFVGEDFE